MPLSLDRRLALVEWARTTGAWILEDDYDSEFRFEGSPIPALYAVDDDARVIYIGTFSKSVFPSLRLGFAVVPHDLIEPFSQARAYRDHHAPVHPQATLTEFIAGGHFARHVRTMRTLYRSRQARLLELLRAELGGALEVAHTDTGLHVTALLAGDASDRAVAASALEEGVRSIPLSAFSERPPGRGGLVLGFANVGEGEMTAGVEALARAVERSLRS